MALITSLTPEQEDKMIEYRDRAISIGLDTTSVVSEDVTKFVMEELYPTLLGRAVPKRVVVMPSPESAWYAVCLFALALERKEKVDENLLKMLPIIVEAIHNDKELPKHVAKAMKDVFKISCVWPYLDGQFSAHVFGYYDYMREVLGVEGYDARYDIWRKTMYMGPIWTLDDVCVVSDRPESISLQEGMLHNETGPALKYRDGFTLYATHGTRLTREIVMMPAAEMDTDWLKKNFASSAVNAQVRAEIARKVGIDIIGQRLGWKVKDRAIVTKNKEGVTVVKKVAKKKWGSEITNPREYELVTINLGDGLTRPFLKMYNPSEQIFHVEGVSPECTTVEEAIQFRNGMVVAPDTLA